MKTKTGIPFGLKSIRTDEFATIELASIQSKKIQLDHSFTFSLNKDLNEIAVSFKIKFATRERPFIVLRITCIFEINPKSLLVSAKGREKTIQIPKDFMTHLASLTAGTARGVLHTKLEPTQFNTYLLPIIDVSKSFKDNVQFDLT